MLEKGKEAKKTNHTTTIFRRSLFIYLLAPLPLSQCHAQTLSELLPLARSAPGPSAAPLWRQILALSPLNAEAHLQLGLLLVDDGQQEEGILLLEKVLDGDVDPPLQMGRAQVFVLSNFVGRWHWEMKEYRPAERYLKMSSGAKPDDACTEAMVATLLDIFPESVKAADRSLRRYHERMDKLIARAAEEGFVGIDPGIVDMVPGMKKDPYVHCILTLFYHSFYYRGDVASAASKHFQVAASLFPELLYTSPRIPRRNKTTVDDGAKPCVQRRLRLGVASGFLTENSSVAADFGGVLGQLNRDIFDITYIYFMERPGKVDPFVLDERDRHILVAKDEESNGGPSTRHAWLQRAQRQVAELDLDILYFLDCTMSSHVHRFAMSKLAPVQAVSHGHPITSGMPREIMDYYISWAGAELGYDTAQRHYTEELRLLPAETLHQYYENRVTEDGRSVIDGMPFRHLVQGGRGALLPTVPPDNWYLCLQKPFKLRPEFDSLIAGILRADPDARILLSEENREANRRIFLRRLTRAGCDMDRVHFIPVQPHHRLLALYTLSDVVLDSYPAGGCTTTREVLELGKAVVTLPARYLGSRWSLGYYNILGDPELNKAVVARDEEEYVRLAVRLGTDAGKREDVERRIRKNVYKMFRRREAVEEWTKMLLDIAPVRIAAVDGVCGEGDLPDQKGQRDGSSANTEL